MTAPHIRGAMLPTRSPIDADPHRAGDIAVIVEHQGHGPTDDMIMARVARRLGWDLLSEDALAMLADEYEAEARFRRRIDAENRALSAKARA